jgi:4-amino-4-deoxy-L-arabinose transferase-like glycosyltransferase
MRHYCHRHGDFGRLVAMGFAFALGFLLFKIVVIVLALIAAGIWTATARSRPLCRRLVRSIFVTALVLIALAGLAAIFSE